MQLRSLVVALGLVGAVAPASAAPKVKVVPATVGPGEPVLVTVTGTRTPPKGGKAGEVTLRFFASKSGYQAVFAVPLDATPGPIAVGVDGARRPATVTVHAVTFPEASVVVEEELANPDKPDRDRIDADNKAIIESFARAQGEPRFTGKFLRPAGRVTSVFGEWRTFNDSHRSQHLGLDLGEPEGAKVKAINAGTVVLVREGLLPGNTVVVAHGAGLASAYYHLREITVHEGDTVERGGSLGLVGQTGRTTGPHLHLSVRVPGGFVDPERFFALPLAPAGPSHATR